MSSDERLAAQVVDLVMKHDGALAIEALLQALADVIVLTVEDGAAEQAIAHVHRWFDANAHIIIGRHEMMCEAQPDGGRRRK